jgi:RNA-directed DNA polymerase
MRHSVLISALARSFIAGEPSAAEVHARATRTLGRPWRWLGPLSERYVASFAGQTRPRHRDVVRFLQRDTGFRRAWRKYHGEISIEQWIAEPQRMLPAEAATAWNLPAIESTGDLAAWLSLSPAELEWFADLKGLGGKLQSSKLRHYRYLVSSKRSGGVRLIETPKPRLKALQRRILSGILDLIPVHPAVHGFVKGRSIATFAARHTNQPVLLRLDLRDFFPTFPAARVQALFRTLGYPDQVAERLAGISTNAVPPDFWRRRPPEIEVRTWREAQAVHAHPHLPQGAPASPALANLMAYRLDCRLSGLARSAGAVYSRYADDLAFSGGEEFRRGVERFSAHAAAIALEEGFGVNHRKTRVMRQGVRQSLAGTVVNQKLNLPRQDLQLLEAILTNCVRLGPESQNRRALPNFRARLEGRVGFVEMINPERARRLKALLSAIRWE